MAPFASRFTLKRTLIGGLLLSLASTSWSADPVIASTSFVLNDLQYRLVDLAPEDGISPWIRFTNSNPIVQISQYTHPLATDYQVLESAGGWGSSTTDTFTYGDKGVVVRSPQSWEMTVRAHASDVQSMQAVGAPGTPTRGGSLALLNTWGEAGDSSTAGSWLFELAPYTAVVFEGVASGHSVIDLEPTLTLPELGGASPEYQELTAYSTSLLQLALISGSFIRDSEVIRVGLEGHANKDGWSAAPFGDRGGFYEQSFNGNLSLRMDNNGADAMKGGFRVTLVGETILQGTPAAVPEPGLPMLTLGGLLVAWLQRRRVGQGSAA